MMNEKGFATIFSLCLILVIVLFFKEIRETEMNHAYEITDFQTKIELQNAADSGIYWAAKNVKEIPSLLPVNRNPYLFSGRADYQHKFDPITIESERLGSIKVEVWGERVALKPYNSGKWVTDESKNKLYLIGYTFFSKAEVNSKRMGGKIYGRAYAYVVEKIAKEKNGDIIKIEEVSEKEKKVIHFMELPRGY